MIDHLGIQVADVDAAATFYTTALAAVGLREAVRIPVPPSSVVGMVSSAGGQPDFWLSQGAPAETREIHVAFVAPDRDAVDAVHAAAVGAGYEVLHAPREWPEYHPGYYAVFLRDLDGHNVEVVVHR
ncbi:VOC family protein [Microlunatus antarcticus]|uniref:Catechol 2,3-dioxygenase-like lactoylglutathione lyase family enzyme n=1 Tax=Microlunatus antarcticus TaxID=53388 RepID=A0A7W5JVT4_9ACTN|nr:VOC family protein [Microlunatus antarcticus]MBB3327130.1 catechol 2,3-dioxygenase-like lactoylglutathione lyase family enzyme [Microlunatus antarcticus]